jgi:hypothetical protein
MPRICAKCGMAGHTEKYCGLKQKTAKEMLLSKYSEARLGCVASYPKFTRARAKAWCLLLVHVEASLSLSQGPGRKPGAFLYTRQRLSISLSLSLCTQSFKVTSCQYRDQTCVSGAHPSERSAIAAATKGIGVTSATWDQTSAGSAAATTDQRQGLPLVHFSPQSEPILSLKPPKVSL